MKTNILLVGEDRQELGMFDDVLQQFKNDIQYAYAGASSDALDRIRNQKPDIIFITINEQSVDGLQLLSVIKSDPKMRTIRVFLYAAVIGEELNKMARMLGASGCMEKTNCQDTFVRELKAILDPQLLPAYIFLAHLNTSPVIQSTD